ncbi:MAG: hypothetical protein J7L14_03105, partial [Candidatus Diapherotrites archaeon]|nr:hypothetical protein [Candidatus Diapherotrites archaeon]
MPYKLAVRGLIVAFILISVAQLFAGYHCNAKILFAQTATDNSSYSLQTFAKPDEWVNIRAKLFLNNYCDSAYEEARVYAELYGKNNGYWTKLKEFVTKYVYLYPNDVDYSPDNLIYSEVFYENWNSYYYGSYYTYWPTYYYPYYYYYPIYYYGYYPYGSYYESYYAGYIPLYSRRIHNYIEWQHAFKPKEFPNVKEFKVVVYAYVRNFKTNEASAYVVSLENEENNNLQTDEQNYEIQQSDAIYSNTEYQQLNESQISNCNSIKISSPEQVIENNTVTNLKVNLYNISGKTAYIRNFRAYSYADYLSVKTIYYPPILKPFEKADAVIKVRAERDNSNAVLWISFDVEIGQNTCFKKEGIILRILSNDPKTVEAKTNDNSSERIEFAENFAQNYFKSREPNCSDVDLELKDVDIEKNHSATLNAILRNNSPENFYIDAVYVSIPRGKVSVTY